MGKSDHKNNNCKYYWKSGFPSQLPSNIPPNSHIITGNGPPSDDIGNVGDIYIDLLNGYYYIKVAYPEPLPPNVRPLPNPSSTITEIYPLPIEVDSAPEIQNAINNISSSANHIILKQGTYTIGSNITIPSSLPTGLTIEGEGIGKTILSSSNTLVNMFYVTNPNVTFKNMTIVHNYNQVSVAQNESAISINNKTATGIYVYNCDISISEYGIDSNAAQIQVTNCTFRSALPDTVHNQYGGILITNSTMDTIIENNIFMSGRYYPTTGISNRGAFSLVRITNVTIAGNIISGRLLIQNNIQSSASTTPDRHLLLFEESNTVNNLQLFIVGNTTFSEANAPILFGFTDLNKYSFLQLKDNSVANNAGKGLLAFYLGYTATNNTSTSTNISLVNNNITNQFWVAPKWISATTPSTFDMSVDNTQPYSQLLYFQTASYWQLIGSIN